MKPLQSQNAHMQSAQSATNLNKKNRQSPGLSDYQTAAQMMMHLQPSSVNFYQEYDSAANIDISQSFDGTLSPATFTGAGGGGGAYQSRGGNIVQISTKEEGMEAQPYRAMTVEDNSFDDQVDEIPRTPSSDSQQLRNDQKTINQMQSLEQRVLKGAIDFVNVTEEMHGGLFRSTDMRNRADRPRSHHASGTKSSTLLAAQKRQQEMKERLAKIEQQVLQKQRELEDQRRATRFHDVPLQAFQADVLPSHGSAFSQQMLTQEQYYNLHPQHMQSQSAVYHDNSNMGTPGMASQTSRETSPLQQYKSKLVSTQRKSQAMIGEGALLTDSVQSSLTKKHRYTEQKNKSHLLNMSHHKKQAPAQGDNFLSPNISDIMDADQEASFIENNNVAAQLKTPIQKQPSSTSRNNHSVHQRWQGLSGGLLNALHNSSSSLQSLERRQNPIDTHLEMQIAKGSVIMHPQDKKRLLREQGDHLYGMKDLSGANSSRGNPHLINRSLINASTTSFASQSKGVTSRSRKTNGKSVESQKKRTTGKKAVYAYEGLTDRAPKSRRDNDVVRLDLSNRPLEAPPVMTVPTTQKHKPSGGGEHVRRSSSTSSQLPMPEECSALRPVKMESNPNVIKSNTDASNESNERRLLFSRDHSPSLPRSPRKTSTSLVLQLLLKDEDMLYRYATSSAQSLQSFENSRKPRDDNLALEYETLLSLSRQAAPSSSHSPTAADKRPRLAMFARQLQLSFILLKTLIRVLPRTLLQKYAPKFKQLGQNVHQNFLLTVDVVIKDLELQQTAKIISSIDFKLLKNITTKKIISRDNFARIMTIFRQNNEHNSQHLKKIVKYLLDSSAPDCLPFKVLAFDMQEIIRGNFGSSLPTGQLSCSMLNKQLMRKAEVLVRAGVQDKLHVATRKGQKSRVASGHASPPLEITSPNSLDEEDDDMPSPTMRHGSPERTTENLERQSELRRCKSTAKKMQIATTAAQRQYTKTTTAQQVKVLYGVSPGGGESVTTKTYVSTYLASRNRLMQQVIAGRAGQRRPDPVDTKAAVDSATYGAMGSPSDQSTPEHDMMQTQQTESLVLRSPPRQLNSQRKLATTTAQKRRERKIDGLIHQSATKNMSVLAQRKATSPNIQQAVGKASARPTTGTGLPGSRQQTGSRQGTGKTPQRSHQLKHPASSQMQAYKDAQVHMNRKKYDMTAQKQQAVAEALTELSSQKSFGSATKTNAQSPSKKHMQGSPSTELVSPSKVTSLMRRYGSAGKAQNQSGLNTSVHQGGISDPPQKQHQFNRATPSSTIGGLKRTNLSNAQAQTPANISRRGSPQASAQKAGASIQATPMHRKKLPVSTSGTLVSSGAGKSKSFIDVSQSMRNLRADEARMSDNNFMLQETRDFILRVRGMEDSSPDAPRPAAWPITTMHNDTLMSSTTLVANMSNNVNFYGTILNQGMPPELQFQSITDVHEPVSAGSGRATAHGRSRPNTSGGVTPIVRDAPGDKSMEQTRLKSGKKSMMLEHQHSERDDHVRSFVMTEINERFEQEQQSPSKKMRRSHTQRGHLVLYGQDDTVDSDNFVMLDSPPEPKQAPTNTYLTHAQFENSRRRQRQKNRATVAVPQNNEAAIRASLDFSTSAASPKKHRTTKTGIGSGTRNLRPLQHIGKRLSVHHETMPESLLSPMSSTSQLLKTDRRHVEVPPTPPVAEERAPRPSATAPGKLLSDMNRDDSALPRLDGDEDEFLAFEQRIDQEMREMNNQLQNENLRQVTEESKYQYETECEPVATTHVDLTTPVPEKQPNAAQPAVLRQSVPPSTVDRYEENKGQVDYAGEAEVDSESGPIVSEIIESARPESPERQLALPEPEEPMPPTCTTQTDADAEDEEQAAIDEEYARLKALVKVPYLPPLGQGPLGLPSKARGNDVYTLVLDLDETLVHFEIDDDVDPAVEDPGYYLIRPGCHRFLTELSQYFEIVIFTAAMPDYADWILDNLDRDRRTIAHRLYRQHTTPHFDYAIKDLHNLGRDLSRTIIIDNLAENFESTTPLNGIWVQSWYDDLEDNVLTLLIPFLIELVVTKADVRHLLTEEIKQSVLYKSLDEGQLIPPVDELLARYPPPASDTGKVEGNASS